MATIGKEASGGASFYAIEVLRPYEEIIKERQEAPCDPFAVDHDFNVVDYWSIFRHALLL